LESKKTLEKGSKYLSIGLDAGKMLALAHMALAQGEDKIFIPAFKQESDNPQAPVYASVGCGVWIRKKGDSEDKVEEERI